MAEGQDVSTKSFSDLSTTEKIVRCCGDYNSAKGCFVRDCKKPHVCSRVLPRWARLMEGGKYGDFPRVMLSLVPK